MKGYKATNLNMTCRGYRYELDKSFHQDGPIQVCINGFHFCDTVKKCLDFYDRDACRIFEVEASGIFDGDSEKYACSDIRFIRELSLIEINRAFYGDGNGDGNGYGNGDGNGYGYGYGYGDGNGYGYGYGYGDGNGDGYGDGNGYGNGDGNGYGNGDGYGYGNGDGNGYGYGINKVLNFKEE